MLMFLHMPTIAHFVKLENYEHVAIVAIAACRYIKYNIMKYKLKSMSVN